MTGDGRRARGILELAAGAPRGAPSSRGQRSVSVSYELYYWPGIQGRGEFVRLSLEEAGAPYVDVARERGPGRGVAAMTKMLKGGGGALTPFAPPFLKDGEVVISHVANILAYLAPRLGLAPPARRSAPSPTGCNSPSPTSSPRSTTPITRSRTSSITRTRRRRRKRARRRSSTTGCRNISAISSACWRRIPTASFTPSAPP